jgi:hypothetical protein
VSHEASAVRESHEPFSCDPVVRFGSTPVIENSEPNFRKGSLLKNRV